MKNIIDIFKSDVRNICKNWVAIIVMLGVLFLPALYAWFNISANMDPYQNTNGVKIAVVSEDKGTYQELVGHLNAGEKIVGSLRENHDIGWSFVNRDEAMEGVESGEYYACLLIPESFSEDLISVLNGNINHPQIEYYINEKTNAVATKVADMGAQTIREKINETFIEVASKAITELIKESGKSIHEKGLGINEKTFKELEDSKEFLNDSALSLQMIIDQKENIFKSINNASDMVKSLKELSRTASETIDKTIDNITNIRNEFVEVKQNLEKTTSDSKRVISNVSSKTTTKLENLKKDTIDIQQKIEKENQNLKSIYSNNAKVINEIDYLNQQIKGVEGKFSDFGVELPWNLDDEINTLKKRNEELNSFSNELSDLTNYLVGITTNLDYYNKEITKTISLMDESLNKIKKEFDERTLIEINNELDNTINNLYRISNDLLLVGGTCDQMTVIINNYHDMTIQTIDAISDTRDLILKRSNLIDNIEEDLLSISSLKMYKDISKIISGEEMNSKAISEFISSPVQLQKQSFFAVENYGSGMTPFYSNLAIWVSGIILVSLFKLEIAEEEREKLSRERKVKISELYFGRLLIVLLVGILQALIIMLGNLILLRVQCEHIGLYILSGVITSFVYICFIYSLAITFKHIGKAFSVLLLILQIPASSGTYPIELLPLFFQRLYPFLPFTYSINALREAMFGLDSNLFLRNLLILQLFLLFSFVTGIGIRYVLVNVNRMVDIKLGESGLFSYEESGITKKRLKLSLIIGLLSEDETIRKELINRSERFEQKYSLLRKIGLYGVLILLLSFLIVMFLANQSSKMTFLIFWIATLLGICVYLIVLEYLKENLKADMEIAIRNREEIKKAIVEEAGE